MYRFATRQRIFDIAGVEIGGQPSELPAVLVGNIFYKGMPEVDNHEKCEFCSVELGL